MIADDKPYAHHWFIQTHQGQNHQKQQTPCQDAAYGLSKNNVTAVTLADGLGSAQYSHIGAQHVVKIIAHALANRVDDIMALEIEDFRSFLHDRILDGLKTLSLKKDIDISDLSSTLMGVVIKGDRYILFHLGDGATGYQDRNFNIHLVSRDSQHSSEVTDCTTTPHFDRLIKGFKGTLKDIRGFVMMTDGLEDVFLAKRETPPVFSKGVQKLFNWHKTLDPAELRQGLEKEFERIISTLTADDLGLALLSIEERTPSFSKLSHAAQKKAMARVYSSDKAQNENIPFAEKVLRSIHTPVSRYYLVQSLQSSYSRIDRVLSVLKNLGDIVEDEGKFTLN